MSTKAISRPGSFRKKWNTFRTYITKPQNAILLVLGIILTVTTIYPMFTIARDTVRMNSLRQVSSSTGSSIRLFTRYLLKSTCR